MTQELWSREMSQGLKQLRQDNGLSRAAVMTVVEERFGVKLSEGRLTEVENCKTSTSDFTSPNPALQKALAAFYTDTDAIATAKELTGGSGGSRGPAPADDALVAAINGRKNGGS